MHYSAKSGIELAHSLSVYNVSGSGSYKPEIFETNWKDNTPTSSLFVAQNPSTDSQENMGKF